MVVFYTTAIVDGEGRAHFLRDVYGHDRKLLAALREARPLRAVARAGGARRPALPAPDAAGVEMDELRLRVEPDAAGAQRERRIAEVGERHVGEADVDRAPLEVKAVRGDAAGLRCSNSLVAGER